MEPMTGRRRAVLSLTLAPALAAMFAAPASAAPTWLAPFDIAPADQAVEQVAASFGPAGSAVFAWGTTGGDGITRSRRRAAPPGAARPALRRSPPAQANRCWPPARTGTTYAAWSFNDPDRPGEDGIVVARLNPDGSVGRTAGLSGGDDASTPALSVAPDGTLGVGLAGLQRGGHRAGPSGDRHIRRVRRALGLDGGQQRLRAGRRLRRRGRCTSRGHGWTATTRVASRSRP